MILFITVRRAQRASERSERSERSVQEPWGKLCDPKPFQEASLKQAGGKQKNKRRFPFHVESGLCWGVFEPKTPPRHPKTPPRHPKTRQYAPRRPEDAPKSPQVVPRCRQEAPKRRPGGQLGSKNQEKTIKKRCRDINPSWLQFLMDFLTIFA